MGLHPTTRCREYREGRISRRRTYRCRQCPNKFQVDTLKPLPEYDRICPECKTKNDRVAIMVANDVGNWDSFK